MQFLKNFGSFNFLNYELKRFAFVSNKHISFKTTSCLLFHKYLTNSEPSARDNQLFVYLRVLTLTIRLNLQM